MILNKSVYTIGGESVSADEYVKELPNTKKYKGKSFCVLVNLGEAGGKLYVFVEGELFKGVPLSDYEHLTEVYRETKKTLDAIEANYKQRVEWEKLSQEHRPSLDKIVDLFD